jgi:hypothetical protein
MPYLSPYRLLGFWIEGEVWEVIALKVRADGRKIGHFFCDYSGPVLGAMDLEVAFE